jgi:hypothetical protein
MDAYLSPAAPPSVYGSSNGSSGASGGSEPLSSFSLLRVHLLRLVFAVYEHSADPSRFKSSGSAGTDQSSSSSSSSSSASSASAKAPQAAASEILALFRGVFDTDWFMCILEKITDVSTRSSCLRLLAPHEPIWCPGYSTVFYPVPAPPAAAIPLALRIAWAEDQAGVKAKDRPLPPPL